MAMPDGFVATSGFPPGWEPETFVGEPVVRVGCAGDPSRGIAEWTSYAEPQLSAEAVVELEHDRLLFGDCYVSARRGVRVPPSQVNVRKVPVVPEVPGGA